MLKEVIKIKEDFDSIINNFDYMFSYYQHAEYDITGGNKYFKRVDNAIIEVNFRSFIEKVKAFSLIEGVDYKELINVFYRDLQALNTEYVIVKNKYTELEKKKDAILDLNGVISEQLRNIILEYENIFLGISDIKKNNDISINCNSISKLIDTFSRTDFFYHTIFNYIFDISNDENYKRVNRWCLDLGKLHFLELIKEVQYYDGRKREKVLIELQLIYQSHKADYNKLKDYYQSIKLPFTESQKPYHDLFVYQFLIGHFEEFESELVNLNHSLLEPSALIQNDILTSSMTDKQVKALYKLLKEEYKFIHKDTELSDFVNVFSNGIVEFKQVKWVLTNSKNKNQANKKALIELFILLKEDKLFNYSKDSFLFRFIEKCFIDINDVPIKPTASNKPNSKSYSEVRIDLEDIVNFLYL